MELTELKKLKIENEYLYNSVKDLQDRNQKLNEDLELSLTIEAELEAAATRLEKELVVAYDTIDVQKIRIYDQVQINKEVIGAFVEMLDGLGAFTESDVRDNVLRVALKYGLLEEKTVYRTPEFAKHEAYVQLENSDEELNTHSRDACLGEFCTIHNRSDHSMREFPQHWRGDRGIMERICTHGVGHPDPDSPWDKDSAEWIHGCCGHGCCADEDELYWARA